MDLTAILVFSLAALAAGWLVPRRWLGWFLLIFSLIAIYALQPSTPVRNLDFWLPTGSVGLTVITWVVCQRLANRPLLGTNQAALSMPQQPAISSSASITAWTEPTVIAGMILLISLTRYSGPLCCLTPTRPPALPVVLPGLLLTAGLAGLAAHFAGRRPYTARLWVGVLIGLLIILKTPQLTRAASAAARSLTGQSTSLASSLDLPWIGFSYLAFRLLHALQEAQAGKLPSFQLSEFVTYALFFPAYTAGPIDRAPRWINELRQLEGAPRDIPLQSEHSLAGAQRILAGLFKKFILADSLALFALGPQNAAQVNSTAWAWVLLLAYTLRIYLDFSGYSDIAIGLGRLMGFHLPENFDRPYARANLTAFWNSWHITLAQWFRSYFFNPLTRWLRTRPSRLPIELVILIAQLNTMILIGLWHGVTWNFLIWGAWHGLGLFIHNRYSEWARPRLEWLEDRPHLGMAAQTAGWLVTFLYVTLGWVWFALPDVASALAIFTRLMGL